MDKKHYEHLLSLAVHLCKNKHVKEGAVLVNFVKLATSEVIEQKEKSLLNSMRDFIGELIRLEKQEKTMSESEHESKEKPVIEQITKALEDYKKLEQQEDTESRQEEAQAPEEEVSGS